MKGPSPHPYLRHPRPAAIAHRGGVEDGPENTMPAFEGVIRLGYRHLETDVHVTRDGVAVAFHDPDLSRVAGRATRIEDLSWAELSEVRVGGVAGVPRLDELLAAWSDVRINLDPKSDRAVEALAEAVLRTDSLDRVGVGSFSDRRLARLRARLGARLCTSAGPREVLRFALGLRLGWPGRGGGARCFQVPARYRGVELVTADFVLAAHAAALPVHVWTVDEPEEMHRLLELGVDGLMTDRPRVLREVLRARGVWLEAGDSGP